MLSLDAHPAAGRPRGSDGGVRAQRAMVPMERRFHGDRSRCLAGVAVALRATGPDPRRHEVVELAMQRLLLDPEGRIVETGRMRTWREEPSRPLGPGARRLTGLVDDDLTGRSFRDAEVISILLDADVVVAGNASFSRRFLERRFPTAAGLPWACVIGDVDWRALGVAATDVGSIVDELGWVRSGDAAVDEVAAVLHALDHTHQERTVADRMLAGARSVSWLMERPDRSGAEDAGSPWHQARWRRDRRCGVLWRRGRCDGGKLDEAIRRNLSDLDGRVEILLVTWRERYA